jgi:hypothetical protein
MTKKNNIIFIFLVYTLVTSCGFKKINQGESMIHLQNISVNGEKRISYSLKNDILVISNSDAQSKYDLEIDLKKTKSNKIKDSTGKVTRFNIEISANLNLQNYYDTEVISRTFSKSADYDIADNHSKTVGNEKAAIRLTVQELSEEIKKFIIIATKN